MRKHREYESGKSKARLVPVLPIEIAEELRMVVVALPSKGIGSLSAYQKGTLAGKGKISVFPFFCTFPIEGLSSHVAGLL